MLEYVLGFRKIFISQEMVQAFVHNLKKIFKQTNNNHFSSAVQNIIEQCAARRSILWRKLFSFNPLLRVAKDSLCALLCGCCYVRAVAIFCAHASFIL
jgi:hypothetical protein